MSISNQRDAILSIIFLICFYIFLYAPIVALLYSLFATNESLIALIISLMQKTSFLRALYNSLFISLITVFNTFFLCLCALGYAFLGGSISRLEKLMYINILIPEIILAISLVLLFSFFHVHLGFKTLIVAYSTAFLGYAFPMLAQKWKDLDKNLIIAAKDLGGTMPIIWNTIITPLFKQTFYSIAFLVFIITFDDYIFAYFCGNSETMTMPLYILLSIRTGISPELKALIFLFLLFSLLFGLSYIYSTHVKGKKRHGN